ncbi:MAG: hypothetical protein QXU99_05760 [Candidatus Bathyarchaeia archaeon]
MPTSSIDTFFACSLIVSVALIATASFAGTMQTRIDNLQDAHKDEYLRTIAEQIVTMKGTPAEWGANAATIPTNFGLASNAASYLYELDVDKVTRLNSQNNYALSYLQVLQAAKLNNIALGISLSQMLSISVTLTANTTVGDATAYTFTVSITYEQGPVNASLHCYVIAKNFLTDIYNTTSRNGSGYISFQIPNSSASAALLVVFARASFDDRLTAYTVYSFPHLSQEPMPNNTFLELNPLNYTLNVNLKNPAVTVNKRYAFSYAYQANLTATSNTTYVVPAFQDSSPIVLVVSGNNDTAYFNEWAAYPSVPFEFGGSFDSEKNVFVYIVVVKKTLYRLTISFGDVA